MPNETLLATLNETLREITEQRKQHQQDMALAEGDVSRRTIALQNAKAREEQADFKDRDLRAKIRELTDHYNSLPEGQRPQAIREDRAHVS